MVKRRALRPDTLVGQRFQESQNRGFVVCAETCALQIGIDVNRWEVTAPAVEVNQLIESGLAAIQEIRPGKLDVTQPRSFYGTTNCYCRTGWNRCPWELSHGSKLGCRERCQSGGIRRGNSHI